MLVSKKDLFQFIPQRPPMVMVDGLEYSDDVCSKSILQLNKNNILCKSGYFTEAGIVENMAQTAALRAGFEASQKNEKVKVGFIGAVKNLKIYQLPSESKKLTTSITVQHNFGNISIVRAEVKADDNLQAEAELSIFTQEEN